MDGQRRVILDYVHTPAQHRSKGYAQVMVNFFFQLREAEKADFLVLAIEDSLPFWHIKFGLILEQDLALKKRFNAFTDTLLLKLPDNATGNTDRTFVPEAAEGVAWWNLCTYI